MTGGDRIAKKAKEVKEGHIKGPRKEESEKKPIKAGKIKLNK